jgi:uncharacterized protein (TIGR02246 family)
MRVGLVCLSLASLATAAGPAGVEPDLESGVRRTEALQAKPAIIAADEVAVRELVARYVAAREARDPAAVAELFTADADQFNTAGEWRRGRDQIRAGTDESSRRNPGSRRITVESVRFATPDVVIVDGPYEISAAGAASPRRMWTTLVVVRTAAGWQISAIRNMAPTTTR